FQGASQRLAILFPPDGEDRDQWLRDSLRPSAAELHRVLLGDYNIMALTGGPREPPHLARAIGVMILIRFELQRRPNGPALRGKARRLGAPRGRDDAPPGERLDRDDRP